MSFLCILGFFLKVKGQKGGYFWWLVKFQFFFIFFLGGGCLKFLIFFGDER